MIASLSAASAQALAKQGLAQLVDATWQLPGQTPLTDHLRHTTASVDTDAIKALPHDRRARDSVNVFRQSGLRDGTAICVYDRAGFFSAPWIAWLLASHGQSVSLIEGDGETASFSAGDAAGTLSAKADPSQMNADKAAVLAALGTDVQIVDARPAERFSGQAAEPRPDSRVGHIPGSLNLPFGSLKADAGFKDYEDLAVIVRQAGIDPSRPVITSCGSGVTASAVAVVLSRLGVEDVRVYQGSWAEWGTTPDLPIETGP